MGGFAKRRIGARTYVLGRYADTLDEFPRKTLMHQKFRHLVVAACDPAIRVDCIPIQPFELGQIVVKIRCPFAALISVKAQRRPFAFAQSTTSRMSAIRCTTGPCPSL